MTARGLSLPDSAGDEVRVLGAVVEDDDKVSRPAGGSTAGGLRFDDAFHLSGCENKTGG